MLLALPINKIVEFRYLKIQKKGAPDVFSMDHGLMQILGWIVLLIGPFFYEDDITVNEFDIM